MIRKRKVKNIRPDSELRLNGEVRLIERFAHSAFDTANARPSHLSEYCRTAARTGAEAFNERRFDILRRTANFTQHRYFRLEKRMILAPDGQGQMSLGASARAVVIRLCVDVAGKLLETIWADTRLYSLRRIEVDGIRAKPRAVLPSSIMPTMLKVFATLQASLDGVYFTWHTSTLYPLMGAGA